MRLGSAEWLACELAHGRECRPSLPGLAARLAWLRAFAASWFFHHKLLSIQSLDGHGDVMRRQVESGRVMRMTVMDGLWLGCEPGMDSGLAASLACFLLPGLAGYISEPF